MTNSDERNWHVLYTMPRWEKKVYAKLIRKGIEAWCPLQKVERQWSDRKKVVEEPIFKSYIFVRITKEEMGSAQFTEGVLKFVEFMGNPAVVREEEMQLIREYLLQQHVKITLQSREAFEENTKIRVRKGVFMDHTGKVIKAIGKKKVYVSLDSFGHVMIVEFPSDHLQAVDH